MHCQSNIHSDHYEAEKLRAKGPGVCFVSLLHIEGIAPKIYQTQEALIYLSIFALRVCGWRGGMPPIAHILHSVSYGGIVHSTRRPLTSSCMILTADFVVGYSPARPLNQKKAPSLPHLRRTTPQQRRSVSHSLTSVTLTHNRRSKT